MTTPADFTVEVHYEGDDAVVAVNGEIDISTGPTVWSRMQQAMADGAKRLVVDLAGTTFMDSTGLGLVIRASGIYGADAIAVRAPQPRVLALFELTGMHRHITMLDAPAATATPSPEGAADDPGSNPPATGA